MPGSPFQKRKYREIAVGIGGHIHVEVVTEEIAFSVRVPAPVALWLRIMTFAGAGKASTFLTFAGALFSLLCGSPDRSAVTRQEPDVEDQSILAQWNDSGTAADKAGKQWKTDFPVSISSVPVKGEAWKPYWKNHRGSCRLSFSLLAVSF